MEKHKRIAPVRQSTSQKSVQHEQVIIREFTSAVTEQCREIYTQALYNQVWPISKIIILRFNHMAILALPVILAGAYYWSTWVLSNFLFLCFSVPIILYVCVRNEVQDVLRLTLSKDLGEMEAVYTTSGARMIVAELCGRVVGLAGLVRSKQAETATLQRIVVEKSHRRNGVGTAMVRALEKFAREQGYERIVLRTIEPLAVVGFYRKCGFRTVQVLPFISDEPWTSGWRALKMELDLTR
ncbi:N-acetyltransferase 8 [Nematostella vectensis]|uniref:N-acetyltransferase 8 n=1 Tax=Nematostella vectensis TaxID=45351 RepID=UPI0020772155|nr:N-acetyltransferase 8 [Nematostella vectensis]